LREAKVLYLSPGCFDKGGISRYNRYQVTALRELLGSSAVDTGSVLGPTALGFEQPFDVQFTGGGTSGPRKARFLAAATQQVLRARPQIVWAAHVGLASTGLLLARLVGARAVVNVYGHEVWSGLRPDTRAALRSVDAIVSDCHFTAEYVTREGLTRRSVDVVWDCVDTQRFFPGPTDEKVRLRYGLPRGDVTTLLTLGRISQVAQHKGYERLLHAFRLALPRAPTLRLVFAGGGDLVESLEQEALRLQIAHRTYFTGFVDDADLPALYRCCDVFSLVSDRGRGRGEGLPLTPLEASACGVPILVGNEDGSAEAIDGTNGYALAPFDLETHAELLARLANDDAHRRLLGAGAARRARDVFGYELFREKHRALLERWL
jgi:phosphatidyl-myo-inositol dimannoside synthase